MTKYIVSILSALVLSSVCVAKVAPPRAVKSEYFETKLAMFTLLKKQGVHYTFEFKANKKPKRPLYLKVNYQNPADHLNPIVELVEMQRNQRVLKIQSPVLDSIENGKKYKVELQIFADEQRHELLSKHEQELVFNISLPLVVWLNADSIVIPDKQRLELPKGFTWHISKNGKFAVPLPADWFVLEENPEGAYQLSISKEDIQKHGKFQIGLTLAANRNISSTAKVSPSVYARGLLEVLKEQNEALTDVWSESLALHTTAFGLRIKSVQNKSEIIMENYLIADDQADTLTIIMFEAPVTEWHEAWVFGEVMLSKILR